MNKKKFLYSVVSFRMNGVVVSRNVMLVSGPKSKKTVRVLADICFEGLLNTDVLFICVIYKKQAVYSVAYSDKGGITIIEVEGRVKLKSFPISREILLSIFKDQIKEDIIEYELSPNYTLRG